MGQVKWARKWVGDWRAPGKGKVNDGRGAVMKVKKRGDPEGMSGEEEGREGKRAGCSLGRCGYQCG